MRRAGGMGAGGALESGASMEWYTPPAVFEALRLRFDLDPCAPDGGVPWIPADRHYCAADDGLSQPWDGRVWLNPPYGTATAAWVARLARHGDGVALVFARTDTAWSQAAMRSAAAVCFIAGRLSFVGPSRTAHNAAAPSMLLAYGDICARAVADSALGLTYWSMRDRSDLAPTSLWEADQ